SSAQPLVYYMGGTGGGVWKTADGGLTWQPVSDKFLTAGSVGALAVAPSDPNVVYAGTGESPIRGNLSPGDGLYKSTDAGKTWKRIGLADAGQIAHVLVHPQNPDLAYVAVLGHAFGPNATRGVFRTKDGGRTWDKVLYRNDSTGAIDLALDPVNPRILYAGLWQAVRRPWELVSGGAGSGVFKSTDGGDSWTEITRNKGLPKAIISTNGGATWTTEGNQTTAQFYHVIATTHFPYMLCGAQQDNSTVCIAARTDGIGIGEKDWYDVGGGESGWIAARQDDPDIVFAGSYGGLITRYDHRTGQERAINAWPDNPMGWGAANLKYRFQWTFPIVVAPLNPNDLF